MIGLFLNAEQTLFREHDLPELAEALHLPALKHSATLRDKNKKTTKLYVAGASQK